MTGLIRDWVQGSKEKKGRPSSGGSSTAKDKRSRHRAVPELERDKSFCNPGLPKPCITVCQPRGACECDCETVRQVLKTEMDRWKLTMPIGNMKVGCNGNCKNGPLLGFPQKNFFYLRAYPHAIPEIVQETLVNGRILFSYISVDPDRSYRPDIYYERDTGLLAAIDDQVSMVEVAKYFMDFEAGLSCGKCPPCRIGLKRMQESVNRIEASEGTEQDMEQIRTLCQTMIDTPHCDFAATSMRPVLSAITFFEEEFKARLKEMPPAPAGEDKGAAKKERLKPKPVENPETPAASPEAVQKAEVPAPRSQPDEIVPVAVFSQGADTEPAAVDAGVMEAPDKEASPLPAQEAPAEQVEVHAAAEAQETEELTSSASSDVLESQSLEEPVATKVPPPAEDSPLVPENVSQAQAPDTVTKTVEVIESSPLVAEAVEALGPPPIEDPATSTLVPKPEKAQNIEPEQAPPAEAPVDVELPASPTAQEQELRSIKAEAQKQGLKEKMGGKRKKGGGGSKGKKK